jgi:hypothetical protein
MQCGKKKAGGSQCRGRALTGKKYCLIHSEPRKAAELGRRGGRRRTVYSADDLNDLPAPKTPADALELLAQSMVDVRMGKMDPKCGTTLAYMMVAYLKVMEESAKLAPRASPNIYQGLKNQQMARVVRDEGALGKVAQQGLAGPQHALPAPEPDVANKFPNDVEVAPGIFRY